MFRFVLSCMLALVMSLPGSASSENMDIEIDFLLDYVESSGCIHLFAMARNMNLRRPANTWS